MTVEPKVSSFICLLATMSLPFDIPKSPWEGGPECGWAGPNGGRLAYAIEAAVKITAAVAADLSMAPAFENTPVRVLSPWMQGGSLKDFNTIAPHLHYKI